MQYDQITLTNYSYIFNFESEFVPQKKREWMVENWTLCYYYVAVYLVIIFGCRYLMHDRPAFKLRGLLVLWNVGLATFSILGTMRTVPEFVTILTYHGMYHSTCVPSNYDLDKVSGFWTWLFVISKLAELVDTLFVVLRKHPLIFLHWYHHIIVLINSWFNYSEFTASARWFIVMNYFIHSIMYSYYALRTAGYRTPRQVAMMITTMQLLQMLMGCAINIWARHLLQNGTKCHVSELNIRLSLWMYFSFLILFSWFFYKSYLSGNKRKSQRTAATTDYSLLKSKQH